MGCLWGGVGCLRGGVGCLRGGVGGMFEGWGWDICQWVLLTRPGSWGACVEQHPWRRIRQVGESRLHAPSFPTGPIALPAPGRSLQLELKLLWEVPCSNPRASNLLSEALKSENYTLHLVFVFSFQPYIYHIYTYIMYVYIYVYMSCARI